MIEGELLGRAAIVDRLTDLVVGGAEVLAYGPVGIGKTAVLEAVGERVRAAGMPCGHAPRTRALDDVTRALQRAHPDVDAPTRRRLRSRLLRRVEVRPAVLLLDHVVRVPSAARGLLRSLRGTGTGVLYAVDVDHRRDHDRARAMHLCHREVALPALGRRHMRRLLARRLVASELTVGASDQDRILDVAHGRPGWIGMIIERLRDERYWRGNRVRAGLLEVDVNIIVMESYLTSGSELLPGFDESDFHLQ